MTANVLLIAEARIATVQLLESTLAHLVAQGEITATTLLEAEVNSHQFPVGTVPILVRACTQHTVRLVKILKRTGMPYAFYIDDNFWEIEPDTAIGAYYRDPAVLRRLTFVVQNAHVVIASTPLLAEYVRRYNSNTVQLDAAHDFSLVPSLPPLSSRKDRIRFGFAASAYRGVDVEALAGDIVALLDSDPRLEFEVIGAAVSLPSHPRIRVWPYLESYGEYVSFQLSRQWDFALAPLGSAEFNQFKTDVKYREYAAQGIPAVYEDAAPYYAVTHGKTGLLAGRDLSWSDAMVAYVSDGDLRRTVRIAARTAVEQRYGVARVTPMWLRMLRGIPAADLSPAAHEAFLALLDSPPPRCVRATDRARALWRFGLSEASSHGLWPTGVRTVKFVWKRARKR